MRMGVGGGDGQRVMAGDRWNPRGYFEDLELVACNDAILAEMDAHWAGPPEQTPDGFSPSDGLSERMRRLIEETTGECRNCMWKDPRLSVTLRAWEPMLEGSVAAIVWRHPWEVARSVAARDGLPMAAGVLLWEVYTRSAMANTAGIPRILIDYGKMTTDAEGTVSRLGAFLADNGIVAPGREMEEAVRTVDPKLRRQRGATGAGELEGMLTPSQKRLLASLREGGLEAPAYPMTPVPVGVCMEITARLQEANAAVVRLTDERNRYQESFNHIMSRPAMRVYQAMKGALGRITGTSGKRPTPNRCDKGGSDWQGCSQEGSASSSGAM